MLSHAPHEAETAMDMLAQIAVHPVTVASAAVTGVSSPWWIEYMRGISEPAAVALPIIGCILGILQIATIIAKLASPKKDDG